MVFKKSGVITDLNRFVEYQKNKQYNNAKFVIDGEEYLIKREGKHRLNIDDKIKFLYVKLPFSNKKEILSLNNLTQSYTDFYYKMFRCIFSICIICVLAFVYYLMFISVSGKNTEVFDFFCQVFFLILGFGFVVVMFLMFNLLYHAKFILNNQEE